MYCTQYKISVSESSLLLQRFNVNVLSLDDIVQIFFKNMFCYRHCIYIYMIFCLFLSAYKQLCYGLFINNTYVWCSVTVERYFRCQVSKIMLSLRWRRTSAMFNWNLKRSNKQLLRVLQHEDRESIGHQNYISLIYVHKLVQKPNKCVLYSLQNVVMTPYRHLCRSFL